MKDEIDRFVRSGDSYLVLGADALPCLASFPDSCIDAFVTDPPYCSGGLTTSERRRSVSTKYQHSRTEKKYPDFEGDTRDQMSWVAWSTMWLIEAYRASKDGAVCLLFTDWRMLSATQTAMQCAGFIVRGIVVWDKGPSSRPQRGRFKAQCEFVVWASRGNMPADRLKRADDCLPGVFLHPIRSAQKFHITAKPLSLMRDLLQIVPPGGLVVDPFAGSGTTGEACLLSGCRVVLSENVPAYRELTELRMRSVSDGSDWMNPDQITLFEQGEDHARDDS